MNRAARLRVVLGLNLILVVGLVGVGVSAHSLGVLAEGVDYLADAAAIGVSLLAVWLAGRPPTAARPAGHPNATALAALVNGAWLLVLSVAVISGAIDRLARGTREVHGVPVMVASGIAALVMVAGALILAGDADGDGDAGDLNMRDVLLDTSADAASATGVAVSGAAIAATGSYYWLDPAVALLVSAVVAYHAVRLLGRVAVTLRASRSNS